MKKSWRAILKRNKNSEVLLQRSIGCLVAAGMIAGVMATGYAAPQGGQVTTGSAAIQHDGANTTIHQHSDRAAIQWDSFNIGRGQQVQFIQPNTSSIALNRVLGADASQIYGTLTANGKVFLVNPSGVLFAPGSSVNVGGLVVSTSNITDQQLLKISDNPAADQDRGEFYGFRGGQGGMIINQGNIKAVSGNVELFGSIVNNRGLIAATHHVHTTTGTVRLVGNEVELSTGSKIEANQIVLRSDVDASRLGSMRIAAGTVIAPETVIYYRPAAYNDAGTKSDVAGNPYSALLPGTNVTSYMLVNTVQDLRNININLDGYYALNNDLDLGDAHFAPIGNGSAFSGKLDGNNYQIANLNIDSDAVDVGLFGSLNHAAIANLEIMNASVLGRGLGTNAAAGILAGHTTDSTLKNIAVNGQIESAATHVGGVVGYSTSSTFSHIDSETQVAGSQWYANVGGVVGVLDHSSFSASRLYNANLYKVKVSGQAYSNVGGITGQLINGSQINDILMGAQSVITGQSYSNLGGLVGVSSNSLILYSVNAGVVGVASGYGQHLIGSKVGGIVGMDNGGRIAARNEGVVNGGYAQYVGGVAGYQWNSYCTAPLDSYYFTDYVANTGSVIGRADGSYVGGVVGFAAYSSTLYADNTGSVINSGNHSFTGGLLGGGQVTLVDLSENHGNVTAAGMGTNVGGIAGYLENSSILSILNHGNVIGGMHNSNIGGIAGFVKSVRYGGSNSGVITDSVNTNGNASNNNIGGVYGKAVDGTVTGHNYGDVISNGLFNNVGGIAGTVENVDGTSGWNTGTVIGQQYSNVGGGFGYSVGNTIYDSINTGDVSGYGWHVGGIVGSNVGGTISKSKNTGTIVSWADRSYVGGLVGSNYNGSIIKSSNSGVVENHGNGSAAGGIVGTSWEQSVIEQTHNSGTVSAAGSTTNIGGIVGSNGANATISNSYNTGSIYGGSGLYSAAGGLAGWHQAGTISNSYNSGQVGAGQFALTGTLIGKAGSSVYVVANAATGLVNCYFNTEINSGLRAVGNVLETAGAFGLPPAGMADQNNFVGWDFTGVWKMDLVAGMPVLRL